jgi:hypothetical protein
VSQPPQCCRDAAAERIESSKDSHNQAACHLPPPLAQAVLPCVEMPSLATRRIGIVVVIAASALGVSSKAWAAEHGEAAPAPSASEPQSRIEWGVRLSATGGANAVQWATPALAARLGIDGEYWLTRHIGVGAQAAWSGASMPAGDAGSSGATYVSADARSVGAVILLRGGDARVFPVIGLGAGYAWATSEVNHYCGLEYVGTPFAGGCTAYDSLRSDSGPYGSLIAKWLCHTGMHGAGFAVAPVARLDLFGGWSVTGGVEIGFGYAK